MNLNFKYPKLRSSFLAVVILIELLLILLTGVFHLIIVRILDLEQAERMRVTSEFVHNRMNQVSTSELNIITTISQNSSYAQDVANGDRDKIAAAMNPLWEQLKTHGFRDFNFFTRAKNSNEWMFFYRAQNPKKYGDIVTSPQLAEKLEQTKPAALGLENTSKGYVIRAIAPLMSKTTHIGNIEIGREFGENFLQSLQKMFPGNWGAYSLNSSKSGDNQHLISAVGTEREQHFQNLLPNQDILSILYTNKPLYVLDPKTATIAIYVPLVDSQGLPTFFVKYVTKTDYFDHLSNARKSAIIIGLIGFLLSACILYILYLMITRPIYKLISETEKIKTFHTDEPINIKSSLYEIRELIAAMASMKIGLQSFRKFIPDQLVRQLIQTNQEAEVSGQRRNLTVFFSDIANFAELSEKLTPNELAEQLSEYLSEMTAIILKHGGTVDKYIGDAIMAFWGAPIQVDDHADQACFAALKCQQRLAKLALKWEQEKKPIFAIRVGINTGEVVVGNIGSIQRLSYTVMGDAVNLASRLENLNKEYGTKIIIGQATLKELSNEFAYRFLDIVVVKGKIQKVPIYELVAVKGDITSLDADFLNLFSQAIDFYVNRNWQQAKSLFTQLLKIKPEDRPCEIFIERCNEYATNPPDESWSGEHVFRYK